MHWPGIIRKRRWLCSMQSFRDPGSFQPVPLSSSGSSESAFGPCILHIWQQTKRGNGVAHWLPKVRSASDKSHFCPLSIGQNFPLTHYIVRETGKYAPPMDSERKCIVPASSGFSGHLLSSSGWFWDQDLSSSLKSGNSYSWSSLPLWFALQYLRNRLMALVFFIINLQAPIFLPNRGLEKGLKLKSKFTFWS